MNKNALCAALLFAPVLQAECLGEEPKTEVESFAREQNYDLKKLRNLLQSIGNRASDFSGEVPLATKSSDVWFLSPNRYGYGKLLCLGHWKLLRIHSDDRYLIAAGYDKLVNGPDGDPKTIVLYLSVSAGNYAIKRIEYYAIALQ